MVVVVVEVVVILAAAGAVQIVVEHVRALVVMVVREAVRKERYSYHTNESIL